MFLLNCMCNSKPVLMLLPAMGERGDRVQNQREKSKSEGQVYFVYKSN